MEASKTDYQPSDIGQLWDQTLREHERKWGDSPASRQRPPRDLGAIEADIEAQVDAFQSFRHSGSTTDKLRGLVSRNTVIIRTVAENIATAASAAFPPSAAVLTAFNVILNGSKAVSDDYDLIVSFFDIVNSFLERISLLESRVPKEKAYQVFLIKVFAALLEICTIAKKYREKDHGRLRKWASALLKGQDPDLKAAFDLLQTQIRNLESATLNMTLRTAIDSQRKQEEIHGKLDVLHMDHQNLIAMAQDHKASLTTLKALSAHGNSMSSQVLSISQKLFAMVANSSSKTSDSVAAVSKKLPKPKAMQMLEYHLSNNNGMERRYEDSKIRYVEGTFEWIENESGFLAIRDGDAPLWCLNGSSGIGKSTLMHRIFNYLHQQLAQDETTSVASYLFGLGYGKKNRVISMIISCALQVAENDEHYRSSILAEAYTGSPFLSQEGAAGVESLWSRLFLKKFPRDSPRRIILVLDGVDQIEGKREERDLMMRFMVQVVTSKCRIQMVTSSTNPFSLTGTSMQPLRFALIADKIKSDLRRVAQEKISSCSRLSQLSHSIKIKICGGIARKADTMAYIASALRHLDMLGRPTAVFSELRELPDSTSALYDRFLTDLSSNRVSSEIQQLRKLFIWLSYGRTAVHLHLMREVMKDQMSEMHINLDNELGYRLMRFLKVESSSLGDSASDEPLPVLEADSSLPSEEELIQQDMMTTINFHDHSIRAYFLTPNPVGSGLLTPASMAHLVICLDVQKLVVRLGEDKSLRWLWLGDSHPNIYAKTHWMHHFRNINAMDLAESYAVELTEALYDILLNRTLFLRNLETKTLGYIMPDGFDMADRSILGSTAEEITNTVQAIEQLSCYVSRHTQWRVADDTRRAIDLVLANQRQIYHLLAQAHAANWLETTEASGKTAIVPLVLAHRALKDSIDIATKDTDVQNYLKNDKSDETNIFRLSAKGIVILADHFRPKKAAKHYRNIAHALMVFGHRDQSLPVYRLGLKEMEEDIVSFLLRTETAEILCPGSRMPIPFACDPQPSDDKPSEERLRLQASEAVELIEDALPLIFSMRGPFKSSIGLADWALNCYGRRFLAHVHLKSSTDTLERMAADYFEAFQNLRGSGTNGALKTFIKALKSEKRWSEILTIVRMAPHGERVELVLPDGIIYDVQRACAMTGDAEFMRNYYEQIKSRLEEKGGAMHPDVVAYYRILALLSEAEFHKNVLRTPSAIDASRNILRNLLSDWTGTFADLVMSRVSLFLADILVEDFRSARDGQTKQAAYEELHRVVDSMTDFWGTGHDPWQSQLIIPLALLTRYMGSTAEYASLIQASFEGCLAGLRDDYSRNDADSFRMLAKLLMCAFGGPELEKEASIAMTCQLYIIDMEKYAADRDTGRILNTPPTHKTIAAGANTLDGDIDPNANIECTSCGKKVASWRDYVMYMCVICTDVDLCASCFEKRAAVERGEHTDWRVLCPKGHRHIQAPIKGWKGVSKGILKMETDVKFSDWLKQVEGLWEAAWIRFWESQNF